MSWQVFRRSAAHRILPFVGLRGTVHVIHNWSWEPSTSAVPVAAEDLFEGTALTAAGRVRLAEIQVLADAVQDELLAALSTKERKELIHLLDRALSGHGGQSAWPTGDAAGPTRR